MKRKKESKGRLWNLTEMIYCKKKLVIKVKRKDETIKNVFSKHIRNWRIPEFCAYSLKKVHFLFKNGLFFSFNILYKIHKKCLSSVIKYLIEDI